MRLAYPTSSSDWRRPSRGQRAKAIGLTLAAELIFVILFLGLAPKLIEQADDPGELVTFDLAAPASESKKTPQKAKSTRVSCPRSGPSMPPPVPKVSLSQCLCQLSKEDLAAPIFSSRMSGDVGRKARCDGTVLRSRGVLLYRPNGSRADHPISRPICPCAAAGSSAEIAADNSELPGRIAAADESRRGRPGQACAGLVQFKVRPRESTASRCRVWVHSLRFRKRAVDDLSFRTTPGAGRPRTVPTGRWWQSTDCVGARHVARPSTTLRAVPPPSGRIFTARRACAIGPSVPQIAPAGVAQW